ncbi:DUF92 domain-containing protein [Bacillus sp. 1P06AnD]|uniref:DUF92 domain-containing protein n=1 Tax=Bacillus sp. 1P06AnD TaxID=3132208 RepID=UPI0039A3EAC4
MLSYSAGIFFILCAALGGYHVRSLTKSGSLASFIVGLLIFIGFQWKGLIILGLFFVSSSSWSKYKKQRKKSLEDMLEKGDRRDWVQVAANGGIAGLASIWSAVQPDMAATVCFLTAFAAANADTWASEIGVLSKTKPFHLIRGKFVEKGTSGAVSILGTAASFGGALLIGCAGWMLFSGINAASAAIIISMGFCGSVVDTILGGTIQAKYSCTACGIVTEKRSHCGKSTKLYSGMAWCNNDAVNVLSIFVAVLAVFLIYG